MDETEILGSSGGDSTSDDLIEGNIISNRFKLLQKLGEGGMGVVWEAEDNLLNTKVALKFFLKKNLSAKRLQRIRREVLKGRELSHENLLKYYEVFEDEKYLFFSMELIKGKTLAKTINERNFNEEEIKKFLRQITDALNYIHSKGIIHRDIKPSNIFIKEDGSFILGDLGIVYLDEEEQLTGTKEIIGTSHYIPPEAFDRKFTPAYDYYSLGITLYEIITKKLPFDGTEGEIITAHKFVEPPKIKNKISKKLKRLIYGLLIKNPEKRWKDREINKYIEGLSLPILPKEKKHIILSMNLLALLVIFLISYNNLKHKEITSVSIKGSEVTAYHKTKKLWKKTYNEPVDYSFFDVDGDGKKELFIDRIENLKNLKDYLSMDFYNYKGKALYFNWQETIDISKEFPLFSSYYLISIEKRIDFLPKDLIPFSFQHIYYPYSLKIYNFKRNMLTFNLINSGQPISFFKWKDGIAVFAEENPLLRQRILFLIDSFGEEKVVNLVDFNCNFFSDGLMEAHILPPKSKVQKDLKIILDMGESVRILPDGTLSSQKKGTKGLTLKLLSSYYEAKTFIFKGFYGEAQKIIEEGISKSREANLRGHLSIFKNLKAILEFYKGNLMEALKISEENFKEFPEIQYFKIQKGIFYALRENYKDAINEWAFFTLGAEHSAYKNEFIAFSSILNIFTKDKTYNLENISILKNTLWDFYFECSNALYLMLQGDFQRAEEILKPYAKKREYYIFALAYFLNKYLKNDFDLKEYEKYISENGFSISCFDWFKCLILKDLDRAKVLWEKFKVQTPFVIDYAIYYSIIIEMAKKYPERFPKEYYNCW
ncbi:MAG: serine/threonine-protein kinase [Thermoanaerobaculia bacterium]